MYSMPYYPGLIMEDTTLFTRIISDNGSNFIVNWINSGKEPDPNNEQFRRAYQKFNTYLSQYSHGVENRRVIEEDMMKNDYNQHDTRYYCQRSIYYTSESICMSHRRRKK